MKKLLSITLLSVFSCTHKDHDFQSFVNQLEILPVPISFETIDYPELSTSKKYDKDLFERFRPNNASDVYGKLYEDKNSVGIIYTVPGDVAVPVLVTYDTMGNKIDSLNLFQNASGFNVETEVHVRVRFSPDKKMHFRDSTVSWALDKSGEDRMEGSEKFSIDSLTFFINDEGKIIRRP